MNRALAHIERIREVEPIEGADRIEKSTILGWEVVIKKDEFKVGDLVVYIEIDSILPEREEFEFLREKKFRIRTVRMRGQISQGIAFPLSILPDGIQIEEGLDVTEALNIQKYEPPIPAQLSGIVKGGFPSFIPKTDETRIQSVPDVLVRHKGKMFYISEKLDGCLAYSEIIKTNQGDIHIGRIVNNELPVQVLSYNVNTGIAEYKRITAYHKYERDKELLKVTLKHVDKGNRPKSIKCTRNHKFYSQGKWVEANDLKPGMKVSHLSDGMSFELEQFILGTLLGDASINIKTEGSRSFSFSHADHEYFEYKRQLMGNLLNEQASRRGGFPGSKLQRRGTSVVTPSISELIIQNCEIDGQKTITEKWVEQLSPIAIAFWYQDDGSLHLGNNNQRPRVEISTHAYSLEEVSLLQEMLKYKYDIDSTIHTKESYKGNFLTLTADGTEIFAALIAPYICNAMKYKLPEQYRTWHCTFPGELCTGLSIKDTEIISVSVLSPNELMANERKYQYDLTVEDNCNYFDKRILLHNSSATYYLRDGEFGACSRNLELKETDKNTFWIIARKHDIENKLRAYGRNVVVQGEVIGPGIQKNRYKLKQPSLFIFNVFDIDNYKYADFKEFTEFALKYGFDTVPILNTEYVLDNTVEELVELSKGTSTLNEEIQREGIVMRTLIECQDEELGRLSFKVVNPEYLLMYE